MKEIDKQKIAILKRAKRYLARTQKEAYQSVLSHGYHPYKGTYICDCVTYAGIRLDLRPTADEIKNYIAKVLGKHQTLEQWLIHTAKIPNKKLKYESMQDYRHRYINHLINLIEEK